MQQGSAERPGLAVDRLIAGIRAQIRDGTLRPGQRLAEPELTDLFHVSRSSVREALGRLAAEGLIEVQPFRGARVRRMSREDVLELNEIRAVLEGYAAAAAARRIGSEDAAALEALEAAIDARGPDLAAGYGDYNSAFHALIVQAGGRVHLPQFIDQTRLAVFRAQFDRMLLTPERIATSRAEHRLIVQAVILGDEAAADAAMRRHISRTMTVILSAPPEYFSD